MLIQFYQTLSPKSIDMYYENVVMLSEQKYTLTPAFNIAMVRSDHYILHNIWGNITWGKIKHT